MRLKVVFTLLISLIVFSVSAQPSDNAYRNAENKYYWQNRMPDKAYWEQDVQYKINAKMLEDSNVIDGAEELTYWNNSPDTLSYVYFHLIQNCICKGLTPARIGTGQ